MHLINSSRFAVGNRPSRQRGVVLLIALIVLIAMTLSGVALLRSVDTNNLVAGNISFHQSATHSGERSTELALNNWLAPNNAVGNTTLYNNSAANGYRAVRADPGAGVSWDAFWTTTLAAQAVTGAQDAGGNTVSYVIHRMCDNTGAPHTVNCSKQPASINSGGSFSAGGIAPIANSVVYYRITTRIAGPKNTVAYIQTIVAL